MTANRVAAVQSMLRTFDYAGAMAALGGIEGSEPGAPQLWYLRSIAAQALGLLREAAENIREALTLDHKQPHFLLQAGRIALDRGQYGPAASFFQRALDLQPGWARALQGLASAMIGEGKPENAIAALHAGITRAPRDSGLWLALARVLLSCGRLTEGKQALDKARSFDPLSAEVLLDSAKLEAFLNRPKDALLLAKQASSISPNLVEAQLVIGGLYRDIGNEGHALEAFSAAAHADPAGTQGALAAGDMLWAAGRWDDAQRWRDEAYRRRPDSFLAAVSKRLALPQIYSGNEHLLAVRQRYRTNLEELSLLPLRSFVKPPQELLSDLRWCNFYLPYQGKDDCLLQSAYGDIVSRIAQLAAEDLPSPKQRRRSDGRKIRVGFASYFFYDCTVGRYFSPWVLGLDPKRFDVFVYYSNNRESLNTRVLRATAKGFRPLVNRNILQVAQVISDDDLDILIYPELGMNPDMFVLAALRLAPIQCAGWGHPTTTGLPTIDWFLSCDDMEPTRSEAHYRESLALLPGLGTRYERPSGLIQATRGDLGLPTDKTLYLVPQSLFKVHPDTDELLSDVLAADPKGVLVLFASEPKALVDRFYRRISKALTRRELDSKRIIFLPPMTHDAYLGLNRVCDVMLDAAHWSGGNTALDALGSGLPIVALQGDLMRGRQSSAMLRQIGLENLVATSSRQYAQIAVQLGTQPEFRAQVRRQILERRADLFNDLRPISALAEFIESRATDAHG